MFLRRVPATYPLASHPIPTPHRETSLGGELDGFDSPYIGHTGSWDGKGGGFRGSSKLADLDQEHAMGLRWTFMPVYWRALEPDGPIDLLREIPAAWRELDDFVKAAHDRQLNILFQAPVIGGNAGGPPAWAGRRETGKSAPQNMDALVAFTRRLAERYCPGGTLARQEGWGAHYGVRAWELDNEPDSYLTHWKGQAQDYAEFATKAARQLKAVDPQAVVVGPGMAAGKDGLAWLEECLSTETGHGSPSARSAFQPYSIGPVFDVISFHNYEGLDSAFSGSPRTIGQVLDDVEAIMERYENRSPGLSYTRKQEYWHSEGNFDFVGVLSAERRAAWRFQFFTRAFASGVRKVVVMDASQLEQKAVRAYVRCLPHPFPMIPASREIRTIQGQTEAFRHPVGELPSAGWVWVLWPVAGTGNAIIEIPVQNQRIVGINVRDETTPYTPSGGRIRLELRGDDKMAPGIIVVDQP
ncbi:MAG TPA: hypothetical protein VMF06_19650 [Candidatus Limnocylindria bacterium]|nr:hypothetical protein [Candidatus Limnocylindria bacterium]